MAGTKVLGRVRDVSAIELSVGTAIFSDFSEVDYNDSVSRNRIRGKNPRGIGFDRGEYEAEGKIVFSTDEEYRRFLAAITATGDGIYDAEFPISCSYSIPGGVTAHDQLRTCKVKSLPGGGASGSAISREVGLDVGDIIRDGLNPFGDD